LCISLLLPVRMRSLRTVRPVLRRFSTRLDCNRPAALPGLWMPLPELPQHSALGWTDVFAASDQNRPRTSATGQRVVRGEPTVCSSALGAPLLNAGTHDIALSATGTVVVGMAEADDFYNAWHARAWGVDVSTGELIECESMAQLHDELIEGWRSTSGLDARQPARPECGTVVRIRFDSEEGSLHFASRYGEWRDVHVDGVAGALRPWTFFFGSPGSPQDSAELLTHSRVVRVPVPGV